MQSFIRKLSSIGEVRVERYLSKIVIPGALFKVTQGYDFVECTVDVDVTELIKIGDLLFPPYLVIDDNDAYEVTYINASRIGLNRPFAGETNTMGQKMYKWAFGYEWIITFLSDRGP